MGMHIVRGLFALTVIAIGVLGYPRGIEGLVVGALFSTAVIALELKLHSLKANVLMGGVVGAFIGLGLAIAFGVVGRGLDLGPTAAAVIQGAALLIFVYTGMVIGALKGERGEWWIPWKPWSDGSERRVPDKILDTSAIIDGRVAGIVRAGFLEGALVVPQFVLAELQRVADSDDTSKRARGRRGLELLRTMQEQDGIEVVFDATDYPAIAEVDLKLLEMAAARGSCLVTQDANLQRVAALRGVAILDVNALAAAMRPAFVTGDEIALTIVKEGKEPGQGVGYLDDGTMVVVDAAVRDRGAEVRVVVTSVLQTSAGRMVFARKATARAYQETAVSR